MPSVSATSCEHDSGQFANVGADRVEHRGDGVVADLDLQRAELLADEVGPLAGLGDARARMHLRTELFQLIGQRLGAPTAGVHDDQHGARRQVGGGGRNQIDRILARFARGLQHHHALVGE